MAENDFETVGVTNVVPIMLDEHINPKEFAKRVLEQFGIWLSPVWFIAKPRLRVVVNVLHSEKELADLVDALVSVRATISQ